MMTSVYYLETNQPLGQYVCDRVEFANNDYLVYFNVSNKRVLPSVMTHLRRGAGRNQFMPAAYQVIDQVQEAYDAYVKSGKGRTMKFNFQNRPDYFFAAEDIIKKNRPYGVLCKAEMAKDNATLYQIAYLHREDGEAVAHAYIDNVRSPALTIKEEEALKKFMETALSIEMTIDNERYVLSDAHKRVAFV